MDLALPESGMTRPDHTRGTEDKATIWYRRKKLQVVRGADHKLDVIDAVIQKMEGQTIAEKATRFFELAKQNR
jgi:hypothetical protein